MSPSEFWAATPREVKAVLDGVVEAISARRREAQQLAYSQAVLNSYAWHAPKKMPKFDAAFGVKKKQTPAEAFAAMSRWVAVYAAPGKGKRV